jgi:5-formyltetrahydrofolate cyclo-ligase
MLKKEARKIFKEKRKAISPQKKMKLDDLLLIQFQQLQLPFINSLLSFYPVEHNNEPDTFNITRYLQFKNPGLLIAYPKTDLQTHTLQAVISEGNDLFEQNAFLIPEPIGSNYIKADEIDLILVPLLAFDEKGFRVGYGKGFYDRFLKQCKDGCIKIGLSYFNPIDTIEDAGEFDVPLNFCITPQKVYVF